MTYEEEYLRACGWREFDGSWERWRLAVEPRFTYPLAQAVEAQLAEDRARFNFMRAHSDMHGGMLWPRKGPPHDIEENRPKDAVSGFVVVTGRAPCTDGRPAQDEPPDSGPVNDLAAVASRINARLNDLYFNETSVAASLGIWKPCAYAYDDAARVYLVYDNTGDDVSFLLSERAARAYDRWLAAGNVGKHYTGEALREDIAALMKGPR